MPHEINLAARAEEELDKLARKQPDDAAAIENAIENLAEDPRHVGCKNLKGYPLYRIRVRNYRVCYSIDDGRLVVLVVAVGSREGVYDQLRRRFGG